MNKTVNELIVCAEQIKEHAENIVGNDLSFCSEISVTIVLSSDLPEISIRREMFVPIHHVETNREKEDNVPIVRCKNCKWFDGKECCDKNGLFVGFNYETFYCADGERRTDEQTD